MRSEERKVGFGSIEFKNFLLSRGFRAEVHLCTGRESGAFVQVLSHKSGLLIALSFVP